MKLRIENREDFLNFIQDFHIIHDELPGLMAQIKQEPSKDRIQFFYNKLKNINTEVSILGLEPLFPFWDVILSLVNVITMDFVSANETVLDMITLIFSRMESNFKKWGTVLDSSGGKHVRELACDLDPELLDRARAICSEQNSVNIFKENDADISLINDVIIEYVKEGLSFISDLRTGFADLQNQNSVVETSYHIFSMLKGNTDVLTDSISAEKECPPAAYRISSILDGVLGILEIGSHQEDVFIEETVPLFAACLDTLEVLFSELENPDISDENADELIHKLKDHNKRLSGRDSDNTIRTDDQATVQSLGKTVVSRPSHSEDTFIPIKLERLEDLGNLIGELVVAKNAFHNLRELGNQADRQKAEAFLKKTEDSFHRIISDLDTVVMKMRMQKIKTLFQRFSRVVRDLSKKLEKEIDLVFSGEDTEIDNRIIGVVTDPVMHLVRNALDHGIETPDKRVACGKNKKGIIRLSAKNTEGRTIIEIYDDGKGLDPETLKIKGVEKGIIRADEADHLTDQQAKELIFHPGFSTAEQVSEVSGRGVGMDVVLDNIKNINGIISIESDTGKYTKVSLSLPSTISVSKGLKICFGHDLYLIPMDMVIKMISVAMNKIHRSQNAVFVEISGSIYPVLGLNALMGYPSPIESKNEYVNLVLVSNGKAKGCIAVDHIKGIEDIVVKPLPSLYEKFKEFYSGCSILSDGNIVLILNINNYLV